MHRVWHRPEMQNAIVISPTSLVLNWAAEVKKWLEGRLVPCVVTSDIKKEKVVMKLDGVGHSGP